MSTASYKIAPFSLAHNGGAITVDLNPECIEHQCAIFNAGSATAGTVGIKVRADGFTGEQFRDLLDEYGAAVSVTITAGKILKFRGSYNAARFTPSGADAAALVGCRSLS